jgi:hypothetical protein
LWYQIRHGCLQRNARDHAPYSISLALNQETDQACSSYSLPPFTRYIISFPIYNSANPANIPPATAPTTPGTFATPAAELCAGAEAEVREAEDVEDDDALEDCSTDDEEMFKETERDIDCDNERDIVLFAERKGAPDIEAERVTDDAP